MHTMLEVMCTVRVGSSMLVHVCHLAEQSGLELCCSVAGVEKLTKGHLEGKKRRLNLILKPRVHY